MIVDDSVSLAMEVEVKVKVKEYLTYSEVNVIRLLIRFADSELNAGRSFGADLNIDRRRQIRIKDPVPACCRPRIPRWGTQELDILRRGDSQKWSFEEAVIPSMPFDFEMKSPCSFESHSYHGHTLVQPQAFDPDNGSVARSILFAHQESLSLEY